MRDMQGPNKYRNDRNWFMLIEYTWKYNIWVWSECLQMAAMQKGKIHRSKASAMQHTKCCSYASKGPGSMLPGYENGYKYGYDMNTNIKIWLNWKNIGHGTWCVYNIRFETIN